MIDARSYRAELARAQALTRARSEAGRSRSEAQRAKVLVEQQAVSTEAWEQRRAADESAQAEVQAAQAAVETAQLNLERTVRSPINGRASRARLTAGNLVAASDAASVLTTIVFQDRVYTYFEADEKAFLRYSRMARKESAQRARRPAAGPDRPGGQGGLLSHRHGGLPRQPGGPGQRHDRRARGAGQQGSRFHAGPLYPRATGRQRRILGRVDRRQGGADRPRP